MIGISEERWALVEIIAEIGVNHNGELEQALELVHKCRNAGVDTVKFQMFVTENLASESATLAGYQDRDKNYSGQYDLLKSLELPLEDFEVLRDAAIADGMNFLATPDDSESLQYLVRVLKADRIKVGSGEVTNSRLLEQVAETHLDVILSTGMSTLSEVEKAVRILSTGESKLSLLHCVSAYPAPVGETNLRAIVSMKEHFNLPVGFSDHTLGNTAALGAVALGASVIEKHVTLDKNQPGPDHYASATIQEITQLVAEIRLLEEALGDGKKIPKPSELSNLPVVRRRLVTARQIHRGTSLSDDDVVFLRAERGLYAEELDAVKGKPLTKDVRRGKPLEHSDFN